MLRLIDNSYMQKLISRMWINQPSSNQPYHSMHGTNVLAQEDGGRTMRIYFLSGYIISQQICRSALSKGWL
jgi:hypothetical protein